MATHVKNVTPPVASWARRCVYVYVCVPYCIQLIRNSSFSGGNVSRGASHHLNLLVAWKNGQLMPPASNYCVRGGQMVVRGKENPVTSPLGVVQILMGNPSLLTHNLFALR